MNRKQMKVANEKRFRCENGYRTVCTSAVIRSFGVTRFRYAQTVQDIVAVLRRNGYSVRSRASAAKLSTSVSVGQLRKKIQRGDLGDAVRFVVRVPGHALALDGATGETVVDTDARRRDRRVVTHVYAVSPAGANE